MPDFSDQVRSSDPAFFAARAADRQPRPETTDFPENYGIHRTPDGVTLSTLGTAALSDMLFNRDGGIGAHAREERERAVYSSDFVLAKAHEAAKRETEQRRVAYQHELARVAIRQPRERY